MALSPEHI